MLEFKRNLQKHASIDLIQFKFETVVVCLTVRFNAISINNLLFFHSNVQIFYNKL